MSLEDALRKLKNHTSPENTPTSSTTESGYDPAQPCAICGGNPICGGLGLVRYDVPYGHELFGKMVRCPNNTPDQDTGWRERLRQIGNLNAFREKTFDAFQIDTEMHTQDEQASLQYALNTARRFVDEADRWLLLEGTYGCGKTHLAAAIANARIEQGETALFITVPDLLDHLRAAYGPASEMGYDDLFDKVRNTPLLILDDLGVENPSAWAQEKLFQLLNHRYAHRQPTIITTNNDIDKLDPRIRSRLIDVNLVTRVKVGAPDYRSLLQNRHTQLTDALSRYKAYNFDTFDVDNFVTPIEHQNLLKGAQVAYAFAESLDGWLVFIGNYHTGKTHLAAAIANVCQQNGHEVMFVTTPDLLDYLRVTFNPGSGATFDQRFTAVKNVRLLVLDDLELENASSWAREKLFQILDFRYVSRLPTVITLSKAVESIDERLRVRLFDERICHIFALEARSYSMRRRERHLR